MSRGTINEQYLDDIAVAINAKLGSSSTMTPSEMASKITSIPTSSGAVLGHGSFSANGSYRASDDNLDGYSTVDVSIPMAILSASSNGTYTPSVGGYNQVNVNVPLSSITISANGSYSAAQGGYNDITVDVPQPTMSALSVSVNGSYTADPNTGFDTVVVDVPSAALGSKTVSGNGTYNAIDDSLDGYSSIIVNVSGGSGVLGSKTISINGVYNAINDNLDGYDTVTVSIETEQNNFDWYEDGIDVSVTVDDVNLVDSNSTTSFYDTYCSQHINTLTINTGTVSNISNFNANPYKRVAFKKLVLTSNVWPEYMGDVSKYFTMKSFELQSMSANYANFLRGASTLTEVSFPLDSPYTIGGSIFASCISLKKAIIPSCTTSLVDSLFAGDFVLNSINIDDLSNLTLIKNYTFSQCYNFDIDFTKLPNLTSIGFEAFRQTNVKKLKSSSITHLNSEAFLSASNLTTIDLPNVVSIGERAFQNCLALEEVNIPKISYLSSQTFAQDFNLRKITYSPTMSSIGGSAFTYCYNLKEIDLSPVVTLGPDVFKECTVLSSVDFSNLEFVGWGCFQRTGITELTNANKLTTISNYAFADTKLSEIILPSTVTVLGSGCFSSTSASLVDLTACSQLTTFSGSYCFEKNYNLTTVLLPSTLTSIVNGCFSYDPITSIDLPVGLTTIGSSAFEGTNLSTLVLPSTVTTINNYAFWTSRLNTLTLYDETISIANYAFRDSISDIYYRGSPGKTASDLEAEYATKYGSNDALKPTASRTVHYVPYEDWHTE